MPRRLTLLQYPTVFSGLSPRWRESIAVVAACVLLALAPARSLAADVFAGEAIYEAHCARCHGPDGRPVLPDVPNFYQGEKLDAPDGFLVRSVKAGGNLMPSFDRIITDRDILNALAYIRTLQR